LLRAMKRRHEAEESCRPWRLIAFAHANSRFISYEPVLKARGGSHSTLA
jgi:hypothetical protein